MTRSAKQQIAGVVSVISAVAMVYCISQMIPPGLAGDIAKVKPYFAGAMVALVIGLPASVAYYYYRGSSDRSADLDRMDIEIRTLAQAGQKPDSTEKHDLEKK